MNLPSMCGDKAGKPRHCKRAAPGFYGALDVASLAAKTAINNRQLDDIRRRIPPYHKNGDMGRTEPGLFTLY